MRVLGLLGGMSWESTLTYYRLLNEGVRDRLGGLHSAPLRLHSVDFAEIEALQRDGDWQRASVLLAEAARGLERAGADGVLICTNTMHKVAPQVQAAIGVPLLHVADLVGAALRRDGIERVGLLGTRFTMEEPFYRQRLEAGFGLQVRVPAPSARERVDRVIYEELCQGRILEPSRQAYLEVIRALQADGAEGILLGCTEIGLLLEARQSPLPLYDSTRLHVEGALAWALETAGGQSAAADNLHRRDYS